MSEENSEIQLVDQEKIIKGYLKDSYYYQNNKMQQWTEEFEGEYSFFNGAKPQGKEKFSFPGKIGNRIYVLLQKCESNSKYSLFSFEIGKYKIEEESFNLQKQFLKMKEINNEEKEKSAELLETLHLNLLKKWEEKKQIEIEKEQNEKEKKEKTKKEKERKEQERREKEKKRKRSGDEKLVNKDEKEQEAENIVEDIDEEQESVKKKKQNSNNEILVHLEKLGNDVLEMKKELDFMKKTQLERIPQQQFPVFIYPNDILKSFSTFQQEHAKKDEIIHTHIIKIQFEIPK